MKGNLTGNLEGKAFYATFILILKFTDSNLRLPCCSFAGTRAFFFLHYIFFFFNLFSNEVFLLAFYSCKVPSEKFPSIKITGND